MALDPKFSKEITQLVEDTLELYKSAGVSPKVRQSWKCENNGDFLCGFFVGEMVGSALGIFQAVYRRKPTPDEHRGITGIVEGRSKEIKEFFARFN